MTSFVSCCALQWLPCRKTFIETAPGSTTGVFTEAPVHGVQTGLSADHILGGEIEGKSQQVILLSWQWALLQESLKGSKTLTWPHVKGKRINTTHISNNINLVTVMMDRASQVMSTCDHKCVGRWPGEAVMIILSDLLCSRQPQTRDFLNWSYIYIFLPNSQQKISSRNLSICLFNPSDSSQKQRRWCKLALARCFCSPTQRLCHTSRPSLSLSHFCCILSEAGGAQSHNTWALDVPRS